MLLGSGVEDRCFEIISARVARPSVFHAALVDFFGPLGSKQERVALQTNIAAVRRQPRTRRRLGERCHGFSFPAFSLLPTLPPVSQPR